MYDDQENYSPPTQISFTAPSLSSPPVPTPTPPPSGGGGGGGEGYVAPVAASATPATPASPASSTASSTGTSTYALGAVTLKSGSKGEAVKELQRLLNKVLNLGLKVDGKLGPKTKKTMNASAQ